MPLVAHHRRAGSVRVTWALSACRHDVWRHLTDQDCLPEWLGHRESGSFTAGDTLVVDHGGGYRCTSKISALHADQALALSWQFPDEPPSRITIRLAASPHHEEPEQGTRLELHHDDLGDLAASYLPGWITHLTYFEASLHKDPLPPSAFWRLYENHQHLSDAD